MSSPVVVMPGDDAPVAASVSIVLVRVVQSRSTSQMLFPSRNRPGSKELGRDLRRGCPKHFVFVVRRRWNDQFTPLRNFASRLKLVEGRKVPLFIDGCTVKIGNLGMLAKTSRAHCMERGQGG